MQLYLLRHADADTPAETDEERQLSVKGTEQAEKVARFMEAHELYTSLVLSSPVRRAHETANIVSRHLRTEMLVAPWLACGMHPEQALSELSAFRSQNSIMLVGHEPDFSQLAAHILGIPSNTLIHIRKASLTAIELFSFRASSGRLEFSIPCRLM